MNVPIRALTALSLSGGILALLTMDAFAGFCIPRGQTRVACQDFDGYCEPLAWNWKIYYTKTYDCCYNDQGQFTHRANVVNVGPTSQAEGDCCQNLVTVAFGDGMWELPCPQTHTPPSGGN